MAHGTVTTRWAPLVALALWSCRGKHETTAQAPEPRPAGIVVAASTSPAASAPPSPPAPPPLPTPEPIVSLEVEGFRDAAVSLPVHARGRRPVVIALHGNYDRPEWQCDVWRDITEAFPFVLCPRGIPRTDAPKSEDRWTWGSLTRTKKEVLAALDALRARYPDHVAEGSVVFTGFSLGAILGRFIVSSEAKTFPRAVLIEGGYDGWTIGFAKRFHDAGGERVLFACGQAACRLASQAASRVAEKTDVGARVTFGGNVGHTYDGVVAHGVKTELAWLVEGDPRWAR